MPPDNNFLNGQIWPIPICPILRLTAGSVEFCVRNLKMSNFQFRLTECDQLQSSSMASHGNTANCWLTTTYTCCCTTPIWTIKFFSSMPWLMSTFSMSIPCLVDERDFCLNLFYDWQKFFIHPSFGHRFIEVANFL